MITQAVTKKGLYFRPGANTDIPITKSGQVHSVGVQQIYWAEGYYLIVVLDTGTFLRFPEDAIEFTKEEVDAGSNYPPPLVEEPVF